MSKFLSRYADHFYVVLRIVVGFLFACHGAQKLFGVLGGPRELSDPEGLIAGIIEFVAGSLIAVGFLPAWRHLSPAEKWRLLILKRTPRADSGLS